MGKRIIDLPSVTPTTGSTTWPIEVWNPTSTTPQSHQAAIGDLVEVSLFPRWDDLRTPANVVSLVGLSDEPDWDTTYGWLAFDHITTETIFLQFQMPHGWIEGSAIKPHVHWMKTTSAAGGVYWQLSHRWAAIGQVMATTWTVNAASVPAVSDSDTAYQHALTSLGTIYATSIGASDILVCKLERVAADTTNDTYGADAALLYFDIHYQVGSMGSVDEYPT